MQPGTFDYTFSERTEIKRFQDEASRDALGKLAKLARLENEVNPTERKLGLSDKAAFKAKKNGKEY